jgi:thioredoxin-like negative regulator of GroEL
MAGRGVLSLTDKNFSRNPNGILLINIPKPSLVLFKTKQCPHCVSLEPVFKQLSMSNDRVLFCFADISENRGIHKMSKDSNVPITTVPIIVFYAQGKPLARYKGARDAQSISNFVNSILQQMTSTPDFTHEQNNQYKPQPMLYNMENRVPQQQTQQQIGSDNKLILPDNVNPYNTPWELAYNKLG